MNKDDYGNLFTQLQWIKDNYGQEWIDEAKSDHGTKAYIDFDLHLILL